MLGLKSIHASKGTTGALNWHLGGYMGEINMYVTTAPRRPQAIIWNSDGVYVRPSTSMS